jgi:hypothetical protein
MKKLKKIFFATIAVFFVIFLASAVFVAIKGKSIAVSVIEKSLSRKVALESIRFSAPFSVAVDNLDIENLIKARRIIITPSLIGFVSGHIALNQVKLVNPEIFIIREVDGSWNLPRPEGKSSLLIAGIDIDNGVLNFIDKKIGPAGSSVRAKDINLKIHTSLLSARPLNVNFSLKSNIPSKDEKTKGTINISGWVNWLKKDMKGNIELSDLDALQFLPYYEDYLPSPLKSGRIFFNSDLSAKNNNLVADCHLSVKDLIFEKKEEKDVSISILDLVTGGLKNENQEVNLDFTVQTKLDRPRVDVAKLTGSVVAKSLGESMIRNPEETIEKVKNIGKDFESFGKEMLKKKAGVSE